MSIIGERIKDLRQSSGIGAEKIASASGINRATIYRYETGEIQNISIHSVERLAEIFNVSPAYLAGWSDERMPWTEKTPAIMTDDEDKELIRLYHSMDRRQKDHLMGYLHFMESWDKNP